MPVRYSTNWMGPINTKWYLDHGLGKLVTKVCESDSKYGSLKKGDTYQVVEVLEHYSAGRIDIRGDEYGEWVDDEYGLEPMKSEDWNLLSDWLDTVETDFTWKKEDLLSNFERFIGRPIRWYNDNQA
jgi:hypothetical protein